jgi:Ras-related protein Rab-1A
MVYDVTCEESFKHVNDWLMEVNRYAAPTTCKLLVGNKNDREDKVITTARGIEFAESLGMPFMETSAKSNENVEKAFVTIAQNLMKQKYVSGAVFVCVRVPAVSVTDLTT